MSMNRYGVIAKRHWARRLPRQYAAISDPDRFFSTLGEEVARQIDDLTNELVGEIRQSDSYLAHVGRLFAARAGTPGSPDRWCTTRSPPRRVRCWTSLRP
jgi:hypothetical protein